MGTPPETSKQQPCPDKILHDIGGAFGMGTVGASAFHFLKALYNAPKAHHLIAASLAVRLNKPLPPNGLPAHHVPLYSDSEAQSWFGGFFGKKDDPVSSTGGSETKLER